MNLESPNDDGRYGIARNTQGQHQNQRASDGGVVGRLAVNDAFIGALAERTGRLPDCPFGMV